MRAKPGARCRGAGFAAQVRSTSLGGGKTVVAFQVAPLSVELYAHRPLREAVRGGEEHPRVGGVDRDHRLALRAAQVRDVDLRPLRGGDGDERRGEQDGEGRALHPASSPRRATTEASAAGELQQHARLRPGEVAGEERARLGEVAAAAAAVDRLDAALDAARADDDRDSGRTASCTASTTWSFALPRPVPSRTIARAPESTDARTNRPSLPA